MLGRGDKTDYRRLRLLVTTLTLLHRTDLKMGEMETLRMA